MGLALGGLALGDLALVGALAARLRDVDEPVGAARILVREAPRLIPDARCRFAVYAGNGNPVMTVDGALDRTDEERIAFLGDDWQRDTLTAIVLRTRAPAAEGGVLLVPIVGPGGVVASLRFDGVTSLSDDAEQVLMTMTMVFVTRVVQLPRANRASEATHERSSGVSRVDDVVTAWREPPVDRSPQVATGRSAWPQ